MNHKYRSLPQPPADTDLLSLALLDVTTVIRVETVAWITRLISAGHSLSTTMSDDPRSYCCCSQTHVRISLFHEMALQCVIRATLQLKHVMSDILVGLLAL